MTYLQHLINWTRVRAGLWVFAGGIATTMLVFFQTTNVFTLTWTDLKIALVTAIVTQITKAFNNYASGAPIPN